jgi:hypothetical protein
MASLFIGFSTDTENYNIFKKALLGWYVCQLLDFNQIHSFLPQDGNFLIPNNMKKQDIALHILFEETHGLACNHLVPEYHKAS